jgi:glycerol-3-phosphate acyltransferase PlsY
MVTLVIWVYTHLAFKKRWMAAMGEFLSSTGGFFLTWALMLLASYLIGSLSFAVLISKLMGLEDPRTFGSKNPGATNVLRTGNKRAAALTLFMDAFKGWLPVVIFKIFLVGSYGIPSWFFNASEVSTSVMLAPTVLWGAGFIGLFAFLGHLWPVFFAFKGGKGVATAAGVLSGFEPLLGLASLLCWVGVAKIWRYSSLSALISALFAPLFYALMNNWLWQTRLDVLLCSVVMTCLLIFRHKENLRRLMLGQESKIGH